MNGYPGGDSHYFQASYGRILEDGSIETKTIPGTNSGMSEENQA